MTASPAVDRCPYCGAQQPPTTERIYRCRSCNLFIARRSEGRVPSELDGVSRDYCPWCAFPVAREQSVPDDGEFVCPGCSGTLTADMLETQVAIERYRKRRLPGYAYLVFVAVVVAIILLTWWWIQP